MSYVSGLGENEGKNWPLYLGCYRIQRFPEKKKKERKKLIKCGYCGDWEVTGGKHLELGRAIKT